MMNKFAILALLAAIVATVSAVSEPLPPQVDSQVEDEFPAQRNGRYQQYVSGEDEQEYQSEAALVPDNAEETAGLQGSQKVLTDFCIHARDYVVGDLKSTANGGAYRFFKAIFNSIDAAGRDALDAQKMASDKLAEQINNPDAPIDESASNEVEQQIVDGQKMVQEAGSPPQTFVQAFVSAMGTTAGVIKERVSSAVSQVAGTGASAFNLGALGKALHMTCDTVANYEKTLSQRLVDAKADFKDDPSVAHLNLEAVPCVTVRRVVRLDGICKLASATQSPVMKLLKTASKQA